MPKDVGRGEDLVAEHEERLSGEWPMVEPMVKPMVKVEEERPGGERPMVEAMAEAEVECYAALGPGGVEMSTSSERLGRRYADQEQ